MSTKTVAIANTTPSTIFKDLFDHASKKDITVNHIEFTEVPALLESEIKPEVLFLAASNSKDIESALELIAEKGLNRMVSVFVFLQNDNENDVSRLLSMGAADVFTNTASLEMITERVNQIEPVFTSHFGTDIDITPTEAPAAESEIKVFVVEDDSLLKNLLETKLTSSNIECEFAAQFEDVLAEIKTFNPTVVILDIMLPEQNGLDILAQMKQDEELKNTKTLIFSNRDEQADRNRATELGADGYFVKAMTDLSDLVKTIESLK